MGVSHIKMDVTKSIKSQNKFSIKLLQDFTEGVGSSIFKAKLKDRNWDKAIDKSY